MYKFYLITQTILLGVLTGYTYYLKRENTRLKGKINRVKSKKKKTDEFYRRRLLALNDRYQKVMKRLAFIAVKYRVQGNEVGSGRLYTLSTTQVLKGQFSKTTQGCKAHKHFTHSGQYVREQFMIEHSIQHDNEGN